MSRDEIVKKREERRESKEQHLIEKKIQRAERKEARAEEKAERRAKYAERRSKRKLKSRKIMGGLVQVFWTHVIEILHIIFDMLVEFVLNSYWGPKKTCPNIESNEKVIMKSATDIAQMIRQKEITSYDVCKAYINRMTSINSFLNAVVDGPFLDALKEAKKIDERIANGQISEDEFCEKPFLGVPFTTKDSTAVQGRLQTLGLISRRNYRAKEDAECVRLMKESGAIIIATSNVPEVNRWIESRNLLIGQTNNPYDNRRSVGGSSGGEAALITTCSTAFGLGTDIGGSIRIPAYCCGIFGHKATCLVINMKGCTFRTGKETATMVTAGPMTRYAKDLLPILKVLVGPQNVIALKLDEKVDVKKLKYYYMPSNNMLKCNPVSKAAQHTMSSVCDYISELTGEEVKLAELPGLEKSANLWRYWMSQEPADFVILLGNGANLNPIIELFKKLIGKSNYTMAAIYALIDSLLPKEKANEMREITRKCDEYLTNLLNDDGILIFHSSPKPTPYHYYNLLKYNDFNYCSIFNVLKVPVTQIPIGLDDNGLPLGIQIVATRNRDRDCIAVAEELDNHFGGWTPPFQVNE